MQNEYPDKWPTFWKDLLGILPEGPGVVDMFCRILTAIDDDVISLDISRCAAQKACLPYVPDPRAILCVWLGFHGNALHAFAVC